MVRRRSRGRLLVMALVIATSNSRSSGSSRGVAAITSSSSSESSFMNCPGSLEYIADGFCDDDNNTKDCGYDGGDCCPCTCLDTEDYTCGSNHFECTDPSAECFGDNESGSDSGHEDSHSSSSSSEDESSDSEEDTLSSCYMSWIGDGYCDDDNNNAECSYDGGDCCACTCMVQDFDCTKGYDCRDPDAPCAGANGNTSHPVSAEGTPATSSTSEGRWSELSTIFIAVGVGCVLLSGVAFIGVSLWNMKRTQKAAADGATSTVARGLPTLRG